MLGNRAALEIEDRRQHTVQQQEQQRVLHRDLAVAQRVHFFADGKIDKQIHDAETADIQQDVRGCALDKIGHKASVQAADGRDDQKQTVGDIPRRKARTEIEQHIGEPFLKAVQQAANHHRYQNAGVECLHADVSAVGVGEQQAEQAYRHKADNRPPHKMRAAIAAEDKRHRRQ